MFNSRDEALELVENGVVSAEAMLTMCLKYMSTDDGRTTASLAGNRSGPTLGSVTNSGRPHR